MNKPDCHCRAEHDRADLLDDLWQKLSEGGKEQQCGWLKDKYRRSWQIVPTALGEMINDKDPEKSRRMMEAMLRMVKIDLALLRKAYEQE